jgi:5-methylcytosine-specific restriction endonuclease McrA
MKTEPESKSVRDLVDLYRQGMLKANPEYQRGVVWSVSQKKKLIDSVMRGYPLPLIYLHHIKKVVANMHREDLEIIDGQQRINALYEFAEGSFKLFDPIKDDEKAKFPRFLKDQPCPWGGKDFASLPDELKTQLLETMLPITRIETHDSNEVRDLFVRLQSGLPLNAQETRDAWPGQFTEFVLWLGGKPELAKYPGHDFFHGPMGLSARSDRGKTRQFAAQIAMLFISRQESGPDRFPDINAAGINDFYFGHIDFNRSSPEPKRLVDILDKLTQILGTGKRPKLKAHDAMHLILLVDALWDDYTRSWERTLPDALDKFLGTLATAKVDKDSPNPDEFWVRYGQWTRVNSDRGETISRRHAFYLDKMLGYLHPLQLKDPKRSFGELEREVLFFNQRKECLNCGAPVTWNEAEVHHVVEHSQGGMTLMDNAALVHKACHPKGEAATRAFAERFFAKRRATPQSPGANQSTSLLADGPGYMWKSKDGDLFLPHGTKIRMRYKGKDFHARVEDNELIYDGKFHSPSSLANAITNSSRNAWRDLWVKRPGEGDWALADICRRRANVIVD